MSSMLPIFFITKPLIYTALLFLLVNIQFTSIFQLYIKPTYITNGYFNIVIFYLFLYSALTKNAKVLARAFTV